MYDSSTLLSFLCLCTTLLSSSVLIVIVTVWLQSNSNREFILRMERLENEWIILQWMTKLIRPLLKCYEPKIPTNGKAHIGNCIVHLARVPYPLPRNRVNQEMLCLLDLYYHEKRILQGLCSFGPKLLTAVSEEAYLQTQFLMQSDSYLYTTFSKAIKECLHYVRFTSDALQSYSPTSSYLYFSQEK